VWVPVRTGIETDERPAGRGELLHQDAAGGAAADDDSVHLLLWGQCVAPPVPPAASPPSLSPMSGTELTSCAGRGCQGSIRPEPVRM
jgi:hypothetical protein